MSIYATPFGYAIKNGKIVVDPKDSAVVKYIFALGTEGYSLSKISEMVNERYPTVEFNKNKINRIIRDVRYAGVEVFEKIVDRELIDMVNEQQARVATRGAATGRAELLMIKVPYLCPECHSIMRRFHDVRRKCPDRWVCSKDYCSFQIRYADPDMIDDLKTIVANLQKYEVEEEADLIRKSFSTAKLEKDIRTKIDSLEFDIEEIRTEILKLAGMKYNDITDRGVRKQAVIQTIRQKFDAEQYVEFINHVGTEIRIEKDKSVTLVLKDGSRHRRTSEYGDNSIRQGEENNKNRANEDVG